MYIVYAQTHAHANCAYPTSIHTHTHTCAMHTQVHTHCVFYKTLLNALDIHPCVARQDLYTCFQNSVKLQNVNPVTNIKAWMI